MPAHGLDRLARAARSIVGAAFDVLVPRRCGLCGTFDTFLCDGCVALLPEAHPPRCSTCWGIPEPNNHCRSCAAVLVHSIAGIRSSYVLDGEARRLVHQLKYNGLYALAEPMGRLMAVGLEAWGVAPDAIVPVPLHPSRERRRGFNQSALLARSLGAAAGLPVEHELLRRTRATLPQVRTSSAEERRRNVAGAFEATGPAGSRTLLLVDDVCTTGATLRACADALRSRGAVRVYALTFARE
jgi:competence protein ComFC